MPTRTLYRPAGLKEYELIKETDYRAFPPRLSWQPIFYPVLNQDYATQIARDWNTKDEKSDFVGIVTAFDVDTEYLSQFDVQTVGASTHQELWIPAERLDEFNSNILGKIRVIDVFYGDKHTGDTIDE